MNEQINNRPPGEEPEILPENIDEVALEQSEICAMIARKYKKLAVTAKTHEARAIALTQRVNALTGENQALKDKIAELEKANPESPE